MSHANTILDSITLRCLITSKFIWLLLPHFQCLSTRWNIYLMSRLVTAGRWQTTARDSQSSGLSGQGAPRLLWTSPTLHLCHSSTPRRLRLMGDSLRLIFRQSTATMRHTLNLMKCLSECHLTKNTQEFSRHSRARRRPLDEIEVGTPKTQHSILMSAHSMKNTHSSLAYLLTYEVLQPKVCLHP